MQAASAVLPGWLRLRTHLIPSIWTKCRLFLRQRKADARHIQKAQRFGNLSAELLKCLLPCPGQLCRQFFRFRFYTVPPGRELFQTLIGKFDGFKLCPCFLSKGKHLCNSRAIFAFEVPQKVQTVLNLLELGSIKIHAVERIFKLLREILCGVVEISYTLAQRGKDIREVADLSQLALCFAQQVNTALKIIPALQRGIRGAETIEDLLRIPNLVALFCQLFLFPSTGCAESISST